MKYRITQKRLHVILNPAKVIIVTSQDSSLYGLVPSEYQNFIMDFLATKFRNDVGPDWTSVIISDLRGIFWGPKTNVFSK